MVHLRIVIVVVVVVVVVVVIVVVVATLLHEVVVQGAVVEERTRVYSEWVVGDCHSLRVAVGCGHVRSRPVTFGRVVGRGSSLGGIRPDQAGSGGCPTMSVEPDEPVDWTRWHWHADPDDFGRERDGVPPNRTPRPSQVYTSRRRGRRGHRRLLL